MKKTKLLQPIRKGVQIFAILLTILGILGGFSWIKGLFVITTLLMGPVFCGWVCPFGTIQDFMSKLGRMLHIKKRILPQKINLALKPLRYLLLAISVLISTDFIFTLFSFDPRANFTTFLSGNAIALAGWLAIGAFMAISFFYERPFCNALCIEGARYGLMSAVRPFTIIRNTASCVNCGKCDSVCPMHIDISGHEQVRSLQCINCMSCVSSCPVSDTLELKAVPLKTLKQKLSAGIITLCLLSGIAYAAYNGDSSFSFAQQAVDTEASTDVTTIDPSNSLSSTSYSSVDGDAAGIADGTYTGTGSGFRGDMTVAVTVENEQITAIEIVDTSDDSKWLNRAYSGVSEDIISEQTADVDTVSGATYSSIGIIDAVADALANADLKTSSEYVADSNTPSQESISEASEEIEATSVDTNEAETTLVSTTTVDTTEVSTTVGGAATGVPDGTYAGTGTGFRGDMTVEVTVENETITAIEIVSTSDDANWFDRAYSTVSSEILSEQTADVDTVSGATYSSTGIKQAVANALINAGSSTQEAIESTLPTGGHGHGGDRPSKSF